MIKGAMRTGKVQMFLRISWRLTCQHFTEKKSHHGSRGHVHRSLNRYNQSENVRYLSVGRNISTCHLSMPDIPSLTNKLLLPWVTSLSLSLSLGQQFRPASLNHRSLVMIAGDFSSVNTRFTQKPIHCLSKSLLCSSPNILQIYCMLERKMCCFDIAVKNPNDKSVLFWHSSEDPQWDIFP